MASKKPSRPRSRRPSLPRIPGLKAPDWWGLADKAIRTYGAPSLRRAEILEPAGDPPSDWPGTRPEWAMYWAFTTLGLAYGIDFEYRLKMPLATASRFGEVDFLLWKSLVAVEVQGTFWHYGQGSQKQSNDLVKKALVEAAGFVMVWVDEPDALSDPIYFAKEALKGRDHSARSKGII